MKDELKTQAKELILSKIVYSMVSAMKKILSN